MTGISSMWTSAVSSFKTAGESLTQKVGSDSNILGMLFGGIGNLLSAGLHAGIGFLKATLAVPELALHGLSFLGGKPSAPETKTDKAATGDPAGGPTASPTGGPAAGPAGGPAGGPGAPPAGKPRLPSGDGDSPEQQKAALTAAANNAQTASETATSAIKKATSEPAKKALDTAATALTNANKAITDPTIDKGTAAKAATDAAKAATDAATLAEKAKDDEGKKALNAASSELTDAAKALTAIAPKPESKPSNVPEIVAPTDTSNKDKELITKANELVSSTNNKKAKAEETALLIEGVLNSIPSSSLSSEQKSNLSSLFTLAATATSKAAKDEKNTKDGKAAHAATITAIEALRTAVSPTKPAAKPLTQPEKEQGFKTLLQNVKDGKIPTLPNYESAGFELKPEKLDLINNAVKKMVSENKNNTEIVSEIIRIKDSQK